MFDHQYFYTPPKTVGEWGPIIKESLERTPPENRPGEKWVERVAMPINQPNRKNKNGECTNSARAENPGTRETGPFERGVDVRELPPHTLLNEETNEDDLVGGYGRYEVFVFHGYSVWMYDRYVSDPSSRTPRQLDDEDVKSDSGLSSNGDFRGKPPVKRDYVSALVDKIKKYDWKRDQCKSWFKNDIKHCLSKDQVNEYIADAIRIENADGRVEWFKENDVVQALTSEEVKAAVLNTSDADKGNDQRYLRTLLAQMREYVEASKHDLSEEECVQKYCTHNTKASTHDQIDDSHKGMVKIANDALELIVKFSDHLYMNRRKWGENHKPFSFNHQMQQKKGTGVRVGTIVELNK
jgi:hypothetical protein